MGAIPLAVPPSMLELQQRRRGNLGLHNAVARGDIGSISYALLGGQPIDSVERGLQAIHVAAAQSDTMVVDIDAKTTVYTKQRVAVPELRSRGSISLIRELGTSAISSPMSFTSGLNAMEGHEPLQVTPGMETAMETWYCGATPLHFAVANKRMLVVGLLVAHGASLDIQDSYGNTAEALAEARGDADVVHLLQLGAQTAADRLAVQFSLAHVSRHLTTLPSEPPQEPLAVAIPSPKVPSIRRHTSGEADSSYMPFAYSPASPTTRQMKHRNTSPIGVRPLSITNSMYYAEQQAMRMRPQSADAAHAEASKPENPVRRRPGQIKHIRPDLPVSRSSSTNSRRERSYTDSVIESAWHSFLRKTEESESEQNVHKIVAGMQDCGEEAPLAELWMWKQAAMAVRNRRSHSLNVTTVPRSSSDDYVADGRSAFVRPSLSNLRFEQT
ncbi:hypothetical protein DL89DRAFT_323567 [Linderina pennispora]|uniref:Uncharacterized protein n=1 Tax=Linderina pennispora TaxID=61395 RepID=A0A1Y1W585_9FUNG|nr:uncharacterized protein DL89DRAFT_323567 [Linderina pennispora]ORX68687.1 hypothetical protein DL89DRAFT_323567 [Linderina pennispora]